MRRGLRNKSKWWYWFLPAFIVIGIIYIYPLISVFVYSFSNAKIGRSNEYVYTLASYKEVLLNTEFWYSLKITLYFALGSVLFQLLIGMLVALLINTDLHGAGIVKVSMIIAWICPGVIAGILWQIIFSSASWGIINNLIQGLEFDKISFLSTPFSALNCALIANIWKGTGFSGIMQYASLKSIPVELYESADLDGANRWQSFFSITLPQMKPMLMINLVLITISSINTYDSIYSLTGGGPGISTTVLPLMTYKSVFTNLKLGVGSVYAVILLLISVILTMIYIRLMDSREDEIHG